MQAVNKKHTTNHLINTALKQAANKKQTTNYPINTALQRGDTSEAPHPSPARALARASFMFC